MRPPIHAQSAGVQKRSPCCGKWSWESSKPGRCPSSTRWPCSAPFGAPVAAGAEGRRHRRGRRHQRKDARSRWPAPCQVARPQIWSVWLPPKQPATPIRGRGASPATPPAVRSARRPLRSTTPSRSLPGAAQRSSRTQTVRTPQCQLHEAERDQRRGHGAAGRQRQHETLLARRGGRPVPAAATAHRRLHRQPGDRRGAPHRAVHRHFGDGSASSAQHPTHVYSEPGTRTVTLAVANALAAAPRATRSRSRRRPRTSTSPRRPPAASLCAAPPSATRSPPPQPPR